MSDMTRRAQVLALAAALVALLLLAATARSAEPYPGCQPYQITSYSPTGIVGCIVYGQGTASWYHGTSAARNDCVWPWKSCVPITITSRVTGISITVEPHMYCDCYTGTSRERIVDLTLEQVLALGLDPSSGLFAVTVEPAAGVDFPNTAMH